MKKYKFLINNLSRVAKFLNLAEDEIKYIDLTHPLTDKSSKKLAKKIPRLLDAELIQSFEDKTGLVLSYNIFEDEENYRTLDKDGYHRNMEETTIEPDIIIIDKNFDRGWI